MHNQSIYRLTFAFIISVLTFVSTTISADNNSEAKDGKAVVKAVVPKFFPPQYSVDKAGNPKGFAIDVMDRIAEIAGIKIEYSVVDTWEDVAREIKSGRADLIPNMGISDSRKQWLDYTQPVETFNVSLFVRKATFHIRSDKDPSGHRVGVVRTNIAE